MKKNAKRRKINKRPSKARSKRIAKINRSFAKKPKLQSKVRQELEKELLYEFEKIAQADERLQRVSDKRADKIARKTKSDLEKKYESKYKSKIARLYKKIEVKNDTIYSFKKKNETKNRKTFSIDIYPKDRIDLLDISITEDEVYSMLLPYLTAILKKVRKPRDEFSIHLGYFDGIGDAFVSTKFRDMEPIPETQEEALRECIQKVMESALIYSQNFTDFYINRLSLRMYDQK